MKALIDTNVWLDIILDRAPHYEDSAAAVSLLDQPDHSAWLSAHAVTTIFYLVDRARDRQTATEAVKTLLERARVSPVDESILRDALATTLPDFEDAVVDASAYRTGLDAIVTRNARDFEKSEISVYTPSELVSALVSA